MRVSVPTWASLGQLYQAGGLPYVEVLWLILSPAWAPALSPSLPMLTFIKLQLTLYPSLQYHAHLPHS